MPPKIQTLPIFINHQQNWTEEEKYEFLNIQTKYELHLKCQEGKIEPYLEKMLNAQNPQTLKLLQIKPSKNEARMKMEQNEAEKMFDLIV